MMVNNFFVYVNLLTIPVLFYPVAMVDLERTVYKVSEDVGAVEVCAVVSSPSIWCPVAVQFEVTLSTGDSSAGTGICIFFVCACVYINKQYSHYYSTGNLQGFEGIRYILVELCTIVK